MLRKIVPMLLVAFWVGALTACQSNGPMMAGADPGLTKSPAERTRTPAAAPADVRRELLRQAMRGLRYDSGLAEVDETFAAAIAERGDLPAAKAAYEQGLDLLRQNRSIDAIAALTRAVVIWPDEPDFYAALAQGLIRKGKDTEAAAALRSALRLSPDSAELHLALADALGRPGDFKGAIAELETALQLDPGYGEAHTRLAILLYYANDQAGAWEHVRAAEALGAEVPPQFILLLNGDMPEPLSGGERTIQVGPQVRIDVAGGTHAANETTMASTELTPLEVVGAWNDWRDSTSSELIRMGVAVSLDGGGTWSDFLVRPPPANRSDVEGDPMTCYDNRTGTLWVGAITFSAGSNSGVFVARKVPGSTSFEPPVMARVSSAPDKCWMAAGPDPNNPDLTRVYIAYNEGCLRSTDMGQTWAGPVSLGSGIGFLPRVGPAGQVYIAYWDYGSGVKLKRSLNGGTSFTTYNIATRLDVWGTQDGSRFPGTFRVPSMNYLAVDPNDGTLYCVYFDTTSHSGNNYNVDLYFTKSVNQGANWSTPVIILPRTGDQFFPWLEVDRTGRIHMLYYDSGNTIQQDDAAHGFFDAYYATSADAGATWTSYRLTPASFDSYNDGLNRPDEFLGDYNGLGIAGNRVYPCYLSTQNGNPDIFTNVILTLALGDVNGDGNVDNFDITPFVFALTHTLAEFQAAYPDGCYSCADVNSDGNIDNFDITPFVALLSG